MTIYVICNQKGRKEIKEEDWNNFVDRMHVEGLIHSKRDIKTLDNNLGTPNKEEVGFMTPSKLGKLQKDSLRTQRGQDKGSLKVEPERKAVVAMNKATRN